ncbi:porin [Pseudomonas sp. R2.Fl]|nr:porin [Pseudomonas sp. R2.Fl]
MNIKSLLIGSAAALAVVSGAQAADAIVAAEPEPMEYVRVCDAFGTGYFYIPGTETCLKISGYVRFQADFRGETDAGLDSGYRTNTRAYLEFDAKSDSELGTVGAYIAYEADSRSTDDFAYIDTAIISIGGLEVGHFYNDWDNGLSGETDMFDDGPLSSVAGGVAYIGGNTLNDGIRYTYSSDAFLVSGSLHYFDEETGWKTDGADDLGIEGKVGATFGGVSITVNGSYDFGFEEGAVRAILTADLGPGAFALAGVWSSGASRYWDFSEWSVAAEYKIAVTEKFSITPGAQYWGSVFYDADGDYFGGDAWRVGLTADYKITDGLTSKLSLQYTDVDDVDSNWTGFVRLQRSF